ncbi:hypothetical protein GUJ93_ZPchr0005g15926 [Zizania palustris]|uniref:Uncharacterized protein n=1 Tax=Zizania palustris TaxID=103762 RepID=A0A8J5S2E7_ZIZPA|nr:hypothetical protein GUJ93_ZPchr0005g15926 [Zizania palustris]
MRRRGPALRLVEEEGKVTHACALAHQTIDVWSTMEPVAADESTAGDVGSVQNMRLMRLVVDIGNNRTIEIPLRGQLVVHNSGSGAAAEAAAGVDDGGAAAQAAADDDGGGAAAEAAADDDGGAAAEAAAGDVGGAVSEGAAGHVGGAVSQAAAGDDSSLSEKEHLHAKVAHMMTVAALDLRTNVVPGGDAAAHLDSHQLVSYVFSHGIGWC